MVTNFKLTNLKHNCVNLFFYLLIRQNDAILWTLDKEIQESWSSFLSYKMSINYLKKILKY